MLTDSAVLVPIIERVDGDHVLLTRRTDTVRHHKGQICFPGGVRDPLDTDLWVTALREIREELGIAPERLTLLYKLQETFTPSGYHITPFAARLDGVGEIIPNPDEIAEYFTVPVKHLADPANVRFEDKTFNGESHRIPFYSFGERVIWGATGRIILSLLARLAG